MSIRLIEVKTMQLKLFNSLKAPRYVILSHNWVENEEVSYQEMCQIAEGISHPAKRKSGYRKIWETCRQTMAHGCTGIDAEVLEDHTAMYSIPVDRRMSWASRRITTRVEDIAYCLLGIFDIHMPMLYGEGEKAFVRLQEEIIRRFNDTSIFLFSPNASALYSFSPSEAKQKLGQNNTMFNSTMETPNTSDGQYSECQDGDYLKEISTYQLCGMFADSPADFASSEDIVHASESRVPFDKQAFSISSPSSKLEPQRLYTA
ncbi:hypothetical protein COL922a_003635 [Colletotrichum nupharicola]|nr:hypothetical protein COL922a_003635 [Colletotrichum nupharicola]